MTTTEQDKDPGIDEIMQANIPDKDKAHFIADLAKHRGRCMDADADTMTNQVQLLAEQHAEITLLRRQLSTRSPWDNFKIWLQRWAKS